MTRMRQGVLSDYFDQVAYKRLTPHEVDPNVSNGHEFQGVSRFRDLLGTEKRELQAAVLYLSSDEAQPISRDEGVLTWYDSRKGKTHRGPEYRLYYPAEMTFIQKNAREDDLCVVAVPSPTAAIDAELLIIIAEKDSTWERQVEWLFGLKKVPKARSFVVQPVAGDADMGLGYAPRLLLEELGIIVRDTPDDLVREVLEKHGEVFPRTATMSDLAASLVDEREFKDDPDTALLSLMDYEESLFRGVERHHVAIRLRKGFGEDVDAFVAYSLSVQNRRKSRVGYALESHVARILRANKVRFDHGCRLADGSRPDFIIPGAKEYGDPGFPVDGLMMLGAKSTCKDRWRQVLAEAKRMRTRHLLTLEPAISIPQTTEMQQSSLQLVVPKGLHASYTDTQRGWLWSVESFCRHAARL